MEPHHAVGTDQDIAAQLVDVAGRSPQPPAAAHAVSAVQLQRRVQQNRPLEARVPGIRLDEGSGFEGDDRHADAERGKLMFPLSQLRQMLAARQSGEVPMKDKQEPSAGIVVEPVNVAPGVRQLKRRRWLAASRVHNFLPWKGDRSGQPHGGNELTPILRSSPGQGISTVVLLTLSDRRTSVYCEDLEVDDRIEDMNSDTYDYSTFAGSIDEFSDFATRAPKVTMRAPSFTLEDLTSGKPVEMKDLWRTGIAVVEFGSFT
jgi:hypothetical protein